MLIRFCAITSLAFGIVMLPARAAGEQAARKSVHLRLEYTTTHGGLTAVVPPSRKNVPKLGLALSGGGAKAASSIGVLKVLAEEGIPVSAVAGTSMGALVGGLYAAGYGPDEVERLIVENWSDIFQSAPARAFQTQEQKEAGSRHLLEFNFRGGQFTPPLGLTAGQKLDNLLASKTLAASFEAGKDFDKLKVPFRAVAGDIETGEAVVLDRCLLHEAIRASMALPLLFPPVEIQGRMLVDGVLAENLPVDAARSMGADVVIAVDASSKPEPRERLTSLLEVMNQAITLQVMRETQRQAGRADMVITLDTSEHSFMGFGSMREIVGLGEEAARAALPRIRELMRQKAVSRAPLERFRINSVSIEGNEHVPDADIRGPMAALLGQEAAADDIRAAMAEVFKRGYFSEVSLEMKGKDSGYHAVLTVRENPVVKAVRITGNTVVPSGTMMTSLRGQPGRPLNVSRLASDLDAIIKDYREKGYLLARVQRAGMNPDGGTLEIALYEGRIDSVVFSGRKKTKLSLIRREIRSRKGDPLNFDTLAGDIQHLYALDYFESLAFDIQPGPQGGVELMFKIREKVTNKLRLGLRYDLDDGFTGLTDIVFDNLTGRGIKLYLNTRYGNYTDVTLGYRSPVFLRSYFTHTIQAFYRQRNYVLYEEKHKVEELDIRRIGAEVLFGYEWFRFGDTYIRYRYTSDRTAPVFGPSPPEEFIHIGSLAFLTTVDTRDSHTFPHAGALFKGSYETAAPAYGSSLEFRKTSLSLQGNVPLAERHTFIIEGAAGLGSGAIPYHEQFGIGGATYLLGTPLLGYQRREFTGSNELGVSAAYRWKMGEYHLSVVKAVYLSITWQAANVWDARSAMSLQDLRRGAGAGLHADTIIGPVRLDLAAGEERRRAVYFSAGFDF